MRFTVKVVSLIGALTLGEASGATTCDHISGAFDFSGVTEVRGKPVPITFLEAEMRPSRKGVESIDIVIAGDTLTARLLGADGSNVGEPLRLSGACLAGVWIVTSRYDGSGDGTRVKGHRTWKYSRGADGALLIEFTETGETYYVPGIPVSGSASGVSRFTSRSQ